MLILRYVVLVAIAALGAAMIGDGLVNSTYRLQGWIGFAVLAAALAAAGLVFAAIRSGRLPLKSWWLLPPILGIGAGVLAYDNIVPDFVEMGGAFVGLGTGLVSFSGLQLWADRRGPRDWHGVVFLVAFLVGGSLLGHLAWLFG